jgi:hypothetical protein
MLHALSSEVQLTGVPTWQKFATHVSPPLHGLPSSHWAVVVHPHPLGSLSQPRGSAHVSTVQATPSSHGKAGPPQTPAVQVSEVVHVSPSLHSVPFGSSGSVQTPVAESQTPTPWHWSSAKQVTGFDPAHEPPTQASV